MPENDSDKKQWSDPKDYGLPFVEIIPLKSHTEPDEAIEEGKIPSLAEIVEEAIDSEIPLAPKPIDVISVPEEVEQPLPTKAPATVVFDKPAEKKKSNAWVWVVVLIGLGIVAVIVWQILANNKTDKVETVFEVVEQPIPNTPIAAPDSSAQTTATDQNQALVNQDSIAIPSNSNPNISNPTETGTTIANSASGNLIRVESKAERPQYFIVVGSLPNERLAIEEAGQYFGRSAELFLITPYDGGRNYRLALYSFGSFSLAAQKLEEIKSQYTEELWILKY
ncbi:hypothetical protein GCM10009119_01190 [Algoriphagus jejuensis]|uniref:SPOR domain-containing protein n=1 Tax=Algoriphagus jejuensis TaxID=419934 RepID=A0ABP3Y6Q8_9BACT